LSVGSVESHSRKLGVRRVGRELLELLLEVVQPAPEKVAVLEHEPMPALRRGIEHFKGDFALPLAQR
jgi:hypothetical protein